MSKMSRFFFGFKSLFVGARLVLREPSLRKLYILPLLLDIGLFALVTYLFFILVLPLFLASLLPSASGFWSSIAYYGTYGLSTFVGIVISLFLTFVLSQVVASPFNSLLAERTLIHLHKMEKMPFEFDSWFRTTLKMAGASLLKALVMIVLGFIVFIMGFIPFIHLLGLCLGLLILATDCLDYSLESFRHGFRSRNRLYFTYIPELCGLACALGLIMVVPIANLLIIPVGAVSGAILIRPEK